MPAVLVALLACSGAPEAPPTPPAAAETPAPEVVAPPPVAAPVELPADLVLGVHEVATPDTVLRLSEATERVPPRHLELRADFAGGSFVGLKTDLERWGFTILDGDGASLRVLAPAGDRWAERLEPLAEVARVNETLSQDKLPDGAVSAGTGRYGTREYSWSLLDGKLKQKLSGGALPAPPELPRLIPASVIRCLAPLRTALLDGDSSGPGWERAVDTTAGAWVLVVEHYGACDATGWFTARADGAPDALTVAGKTLKTLDDATLFAAATHYLSVERAAADASAAAAVDILKRGDDAALQAAITGSAPGFHQERLLLALAERSEAEAIGFASKSSSPTVRGWAAGVDQTAREALLQDPSAGADALVLALSAWRPAAPDDPLLVRLRAHADPRVRMRAWDLTLDVGETACAGRAAGAKTATIEQASALYAECPQLPVRLQAVSRVAQLDKAAAATLVQGTLAHPETVRTGIAAVRAANSFERDDLLETAVADLAVDRDVRAEALRTLLRVGRSPKTAALAEAHGAFLGVKAPPAAAVVDAGKPK